MTFRHSKIWCTTFEDNLFAYGYKNRPGLLAAAMPHKFAKDKWVRIHHRETGKSVTVQVKDKGPYTYLDEDYVVHGARPMVEKHFLTGTPLPNKVGFSKSFRGKVPASMAGLDVTMEVWQALGVDLPEGRLLKYSAMVDIEYFVDSPHVVVDCRNKKGGSMGFFDDLLEELEDSLKETTEDYVKKELVEFFFNGKKVEAEVPSSLAARIRELEAAKLQLESKLSKTREERDNYKEATNRLYRFVAKKNLLSELQAAS